MTETLIQSAKEIPATLPACPGCGTAKHVHSSGMGGRNHRVRQFRCFSNLCNGVWFLDPARPFVPSGPRANLRRIKAALAMRQRGLTYPQIGAAMRITKERARNLCNYKVPTPSGNSAACKFTICLDPEYVRSLAEMYEESIRQKPQSHFALADFCANLLINQIASHRLAHAPATPPHVHKRQPRSGDFYSIEAREND
jgi:hypothetical protein